MLFSSMEINTNCFEKIVESLQIETNTAIFNVFRFCFFSCYLIHPQLSTEVCTGETKALNRGISCTKAFLQSPARKGLLFQTIHCIVRAVKLLAQLPLLGRTKTCRKILQI